MIGLRIRRPSPSLVDQEHNAWWFRFGARIGYQDGYAAGRRDVLDDLVAEQADARKKLAGLDRVPTFVEIDERRQEPGGLAWEKAIQAAGGAEYQGGPVLEW